MEEDSFIRKMKGVKPLKKDKRITNNIKTKPTKKKQEPNIKKNISSPIINNENKIKTQFSLTFGDINKDLKKGKIKIDRKLDLHGFSLVDAYDKFKNEVIKSYNKNKRCILVITGKGVHLSNKDNNEDASPKLFYGKIKNSIISWINEDSMKNYILTYQDAGIEHGGDGAIFVYLRKKKN